MTANPSRPSNLTLPIVAGALGVTLAVYAVIQTGTWLATGSWVPGHPLTVLALPVKGRLELGQTHLVAAVAVFTVVAVLGLLGALWWARRNRHRAPIDVKARYLGRGSEMSLAHAQDKAELGRLTTGGIAPGLMFARTVLGRSELWTSWRDGMVVIMGPGGGKTSAIPIPMICEAPGIVVATSNKRDLADAVVLPRAGKGEVWVFDPQNLAGHHQGPDAPWFWNPLTYVTDEVRAAALAKLFCNASRDQNTRKDAYFDNASQELIANLLLAAAVGGRTMADVYQWLSDSRVDTSADLLTDHGYELSAASLRAEYGNPDKQRLGVFAGAKAYMSFLNNRAIHSWITPGSRHRSEFDPKVFARSASDTLLSLSKEGSGTAGPLTAALTVAVTEAVEDVAKASPNGRLGVPAVFILDEAANTCRWQELPAQYSHYGSRGMFLVTILQNMAQGSRAWPEDGMKQMWSAATIRVVGSGIADDSFLESVAKLSNDRHVPYYGVSSGSRGSGRSTTMNYHKERVLTAADLAELPPGRVVVIPTGGRMTLARVVPWWERPGIADDVRESIKVMEPAPKVLVS